MSKHPSKRLDIQPIRYQQRPIGLSSSGNNMKSTMDSSKKSAQTKSKHEECKICKSLKDPFDLGKILNQGLYHKYTASLDFFYSRDINILVTKRKKPLYIKYKDDKIFDFEQEFLKYYYTKADTSELMSEIKNFYSQFHDYPRFFDKPYYSIISSYIRKHRKLEYIKVFKPGPDEMPPKDSYTENTNNQSANKSGAEGFNLLELLDKPVSMKTFEDNNATNFNKKVNESIIDIEKNFLKLKDLVKKETKPIPQLIGPLNFESESVLKSNNDSGIVVNLIEELNKVATNHNSHSTVDKGDKKIETSIKRISIKKLNIKSSTEPNELLSDNRLLDGPLSTNRYGEAPLSTNRFVEAPLSTTRFKYIKTAQSERKIPQLNIQNSPTYVNEESIERLVASTTKRNISPTRMPSKNRFFLKSPIKVNLSPNRNHTRQFTMQQNPYGFDSPVKEIREYPATLKATTFNSDKVERQNSTKKVPSPEENKEPNPVTMRKDFQIRRNYLRSSSKINTSNNNLVAPFSSPTSAQSPTPDQYYFRPTAKVDHLEKIYLKDMTSNLAESPSGEVGANRVKIYNPVSQISNANLGGIKTVVTKRSKIKIYGSTTARTENSNSEAPVRVNVNSTGLQSSKSHNVIAHRPGISGLNNAQRIPKPTVNQKIVIAGNNNVNNIFIFENSVTERGTSSVTNSKTPTLKRSYGLAQKGSPVLFRKRV